MDRNYSSPMCGQSTPAYGYVQPTLAPKTNRTLVASLDEAIYRTNEYGSEMFYFDQNRPVFYIVRMGMDGRKTWAEVPYGAPTPDANAPATKAELGSVLSKLEELEAKVNGMVQVPVSKTKKIKAEGIENGESVG